MRAKACNAGGGTPDTQNKQVRSDFWRGLKSPSEKVFLLVFLSFLLDIANFLSNLLQCVFVSAVLHLEVCKRKQVRNRASEDVYERSATLLSLGRCCLRRHGCDI